MTQQDLKQLLDRFADLSILVVGDFFLDRYLIVDPGLAEVSLETGLEARQVVEIRNRPGAAGTVTSNLSAIGVGEILALGAIGPDGQGHDLKDGLQKTRVSTDHLFEIPGLFTPTYTKPLLTTTGEELERIDIKNRSRTSPDLERRIINTLRDLVHRVDGVVTMDQVQERNCGVVTDRVRSELASLAREHPGKVFFADSRTRIGEFRDVIVKANRDEALAAGEAAGSEPTSREVLDSCAKAFAGRTGRPVFITQGPDGILTTDAEQLHHIPGIRVPDPIDIVGAGDSVSAGVVSALCGGATLLEAALLGVLASSITIQQIGSTGTASPQQILDRFAETYPDDWPAQVRV